MSDSTPYSQTPSYEWYALVSASTKLEQGDFLDNFPIITEPDSDILTSDTGQVDTPATLETYNVVIMTQSCDLPTLQVNDRVILCPRYVLSEATNHEGKSYNSKDYWNKLIRGTLVSAHLTNKCQIQGHEFDYQIIDLQRIFSVPLSSVQRVATQQVGRIRLLPPYREHLAQAFARQFMRVGLPIDLPQDYPYQKQ